MKPLTREGKHYQAETIKEPVRVLETTPGQDEDSDWVKEQPQAVFATCSQVGTTAV